jgi:hypothetical protein
MYTTFNVIKHAVDLTIMQLQTRKTFNYSEIVNSSFKNYFKLA